MNLIPVRFTALRRLLFCALVLPLAQTSRAEWKLESSAPLPAPGEGVVHTVQTLRDTTPGGAEKATIHFISFNARKHTLRIFDQGPTGRATLAETMQQNKCLAGVNGGYFHPDFEPVGLLMSDGVVVRKPQRAKLLSGALVVTAKRLKLLRSTDPLPGQYAVHALQAGPFLIDGGKVVEGLNTVRSARRTAILTDGKVDWALISTSPVTLAELGAILGDPALLPGNLKIDRALNLDGGSSTSMWAVQPGSEPFYLNEFGILRDFIGLVPR
jgi:uncharacterized protein YigE (DUF2233 family)